MIDALAPLSIRIFSHIELLRMSFRKMLIFSESLLRILSSKINSFLDLLLHHSIFLIFDEPLLFVEIIATFLFYLLDQSLESSTLIHAMSTRAVVLAKFLTCMPFI